MLGSRAPRVLFWGHSRADQVPSANSARRWVGGLRTVSKGLVVKPWPEEAAPSSKTYFLIRKPFALWQRKRIITLRKERGIYAAHIDADERARHNPAVHR